MPQTPKIPKPLKQELKFLVNKNGEKHENPLKTPKQAFKQQKNGENIYIHHKNKLIKVNKDIKKGLTQIAEKDNIEKQKKQIKLLLDDYKNKPKTHIGLEKKQNSPYFNEDNKFIPMRLAREIIQEHDFRLNRETKELYYYKNGKYHRKAEGKLREIIQQKLGDLTRNQYINEATEAVKRHHKTRTPKKEFNKQSNELVVKNGILDVKKQELKPHTPKKINTQKLPWKYDPKQDCPKIKEFIKELVHDEDKKLIQEMFGYCLLRDYPIAKAFMLLGSGANGKSTLLKLLKEFLGEKNYANPTLQKLTNENNQFAEINLYGKLANINGDLSGKALQETGMFKKLTGDDTVQGERKYKDPMSFDNYAKLIYAANQLPRTKDTTDAFFRRWIIIEFPYQFDGEEKEPDPNLPEKLINEESMSGLLNWALQGLNRVIENNGFSETDSREEIEQKWVMETDSLRAFKQQHCRVTTEPSCDDYDQAFVGKDTFYKLYKAFCDKNNLYKSKKGSVTKELKKLDAKIELFRPKIGDDRPRCWRNLEVKQEFIENITDSYVQDVQGLYNTTFTCTRAHEYNNSSDKKLDMLDAKNEEIDNQQKLGSQNNETRENQKKPIIEDIRKEILEPFEVKKKWKKDEIIQTLVNRDYDREKVIDAVDYLVDVEGELMELTQEDGQYLEKS